MCAILSKSATCSCGGIRSSCMFVKWITALTGIIVSSSVWAQEVSSEVSGRAAQGNIRVGMSYPTIENSDGSNGMDALFFHTEIGARYAFSDKVGVSVAVGKWLGKTQTIASETGNLAYHVDAGFVLAISGSLIDKTKVKTSISNNKKESDENQKVQTKIVKKTMKNRFDGFRLGLHASEFIFSRLNDSVYGGGATVMYEHRLGDTAKMQYGVKGNYMKNSDVEASLFQGFIGVGF